METFSDPVCFTKQTEMLLHGIAAQDLIKEFKKRNISTAALHKLTKEDFMQLGADEDRAERIVNILHITKWGNSIPKSKPHHRISNNIEILKLNETQLALIRSYLVYCRFKLKLKQTNFFVEPNIALSASKILNIAADATLKEVIEAESKLKELENALNMSKNKYSYMLYFLPIGGIGIITWILRCRLWR